MGILSKVGKVVESGASSGRGALPKVGMGILGISAFAAGFLNKTAPAVRDAAFQTAFDDPNADVAFLGRKLDARYLAGRAIGGKMGGALKATSGDYWGMENPIGLKASAKMGLVAPSIGAVSGAVGGAIVGGKKAGFKGAIVGGFLGTLAGGAAGGAVGTAGLIGSTKAYVGNNQQFFSESPYAGRTSGSIANSLNASGDIVLGMHNSRRGY